MHICKRIGGLLSIHLLMVLTVGAQLKFEQSVLISKENGLPTNEIFSIRKGDDGFVWLATSEGLCRFDGQQVKVFREGSDLRYSLFDNAANTVLPLKDHVWVGTNQGLSVLNTKDNTFRHYQLAGNGKSDSVKRRFDQVINFLYKDKTGDIWIGTRDKGVCLYDSLKDDFRFFSAPRDKYPPLVPSLASVNGILNIRESNTNDSIIWAGTPAGLLEINKYTSQTALFSFPQKSKDYQVALNAFRRLYHHDDGLLYVGSWGASVNIFDPVKRTFTPLTVKSEEGKKILNSVISNLTRKSDHEIWISASTGLVVYDTKIKDVTWYKFNNSLNYEIYAINFIDSGNRVWYADINGLNYFDPAMQQFTRYSFKPLSGPDWGLAFYILADKTGDNVTVCPRMADGLYHFNRQKKEWTKSLFPGNNRFKTETEVVRGFVQLPSGDYIISSDRGIFLYSQKQNRLTGLHQKLPVAAPTRRGEILFDRSGNLWVSDDIQGLIKWKPGAEAYRVYKKELLWTDTSSATGRLENLFEDSRGNIWFQRGSGMGVYLPDKDSILNFIYTNNTAISFPNIYAFAEDKKGRVWVSGVDGWLGYALTDDPYKGLVYKMNIRDKGLSGSFPFLATDKNGEVWGYTAEELVKINAGDLSFTKYSFRYGVSEADFFHFSFLPSGEMVFGGRNDITIANPSELKRNTEIPAPYIVEMQVLNQPFSFVMNGLPVRLKYKQNFFSIGFSAKAFTMAKDVRFRYRLKGFDDWTEATGRRFANYTNVPGGDYVFQLQAANNEGLWNEAALELPIHVSTSFWRTLWFRIGVVLLMGAAAYWFYRYRIDNLKKKQKMKSEYEKKLANVEMTALLAQMNPHFLFNSLNSIDSYIIRNESKKASEYLNNFARLMRLILQNSRSNYISLKDELEALDLYLQMERLRFMDKFEYEIRIENGIDPAAIVIPPMLIQPYVENAIWHGLMHKKDGTAGKVEIIISRQENILVCLVQDNGIGREKAQEIKEQKHGHGKRSMGMQITSDRIDMINKLYNTSTSVKIIDMKNGEGKPTGTCVKLTIPF